MFEITQHTRLRRSPFYDATVEAGVASFMTYNQMLLPTGYGDLEAEYWRLIEGVSMWDVAAERQVQIEGPDAARMVQMLVARDLSNCVVGQGRYVPLCDHTGTLVNDPVLLKRAEDCYWLSIADSDMLIYTRAIAGERKLDVAVTEPDVSPLAVQGPKADDVVAGLFGDWVRELKFFWFRDTTIEGIPVVVQRSGWSKQGGFEIYLRDGKRGTDLWNVVREAGASYDIGPGNPNPCERVESGLLSWGGDTDDQTNPFEVRLGRYIDVERDYSEDVIGLEALRRINREGPKRHQIGIVLDGDEPAPSNARWYDIRRDGADVGHMTNGVWSRRLKRNIGFALISRDVNVGSRVEVMKEDGAVGAETVALPFI